MRHDSVISTPSTGNSTSSAAPDGKESALTFSVGEMVMRLYEFVFLIGQNQNICTNAHISYAFVSFHF